MSYIKTYLKYMDTNQYHFLAARQSSGKGVVRAIKPKAGAHPNATPASIYREEIKSIADKEVLLSLPQKNEMIRTIEPKITTDLATLHRWKNCKLCLRMIKL